VAVDHTDAVSAAGGLEERDMAADPLAQFRAWFAAARDAGVEAPEAMALATASPDGAPSLRMVLLKGVDERGFVFFSNYASRKGRELTANPRAALLFHWPGRQVRVEGRTGRCDAEESAAYFAGRPLGSRLSAWASHQSEPVAGRGVLEARVEELRRRFGDEVPPPPFWGGFRLAHETLEFWQHRDDRLHDRLRYRRAGDGWTLERLAP
jgi:pyridoxamine 5'-phosphate oxidase